MLTGFWGCIFFIAVQIAFVTEAKLFQLGQAAWSVVTAMKKYNRRWSSDTYRVLHKSMAQRVDILCGPDAQGLLTNACMNLKRVETPRILSSIYTLSSNLFIFAH